MRYTLWNKLARYLLPGTSVAFWHTPLSPVFYDLATLTDYPIDFTVKCNYRGPFDAAGVPMLNYMSPIGTRYNPCAVAQYALGWFRRWRQGDETAREKFSRMADWIVERQKTTGARNGGWEYDFDLPEYGVQAPWISALAQAQCVAVLLRAAKFLDNAKYTIAAAAGFELMVRPVQEGGTLLRCDEGVLLEEVVADRPTAILDGFMFAIFSVAEYVAGSPNGERYAPLLDECFATLERILPRYDLGYWSKGDLYHDAPPMIASAFYHRLHVSQLKILANHTGRAIFHEFARRWQSNAGNPVHRTRAFLNKVHFKLTRY